MRPRKKTRTSEDRWDSDYLAMKEKFEENSFALTRRDRFFTLGNEEFHGHKVIIPNPYTCTKFLTVHAGLRYGLNNEKSFIDTWIHDPTKRTFNDIGFDPTNTWKNIYNLWRGYRNENRQPQIPVSDETVAKNMAAAPVIRHITEVITDGNEEHAGYFLDWLANIVQRPHQRTRAAILIYGESGVGKDIIPDWFRTSVLGPEHTFQTKRLERDLFSRYAHGLVNTTFVHVNELRLLDHEAGSLRNCITADTVHWETNDEDRTTWKAYANLLLTTNNEDTLQKLSKEWRFVVFKCNPKYKGNTDYFQKLRDHLSSPDVDLWFYRFLKDRDISAYDHKYAFQSHIDTKSGFQSIVF